MAKWVIVVDDDTANLQVAGRILSQNNIRVTALKSGQSLLDYVEENGFPDMLLLDIKMPVMDGFETLRRFREKETDKDVEETPVVFLTADEDSETEKRGFEVGVSDFIRKPFNPDVLLKRINNIISTNSEMRTLKTEASTDGLTGLLNKGSVKEEMSKACSELNGCLLMADLDAFKLVNDLHGHDAGDKILKVFSQLLVEYVSSDGILGRIGGDEFVIFYPGLNDEKDAVEFGAKVNARMAEEADRILGENDIPLGVTMGGVFVPAYGNDYQALLKLADKALYSVKKTGKHRCAVYKEESGFDESDNGLHDIYSISEILGERNIPNVALQLDKEAFSYVYRYIMRDIIRNRRSACKVLFTLEKNKGAKDDAFVNLCDEFGTHIRESLRKSDILMRNMSNQYFVFLTDIKTQAVDKVVGNIADEWYKKFGRDAHISIETDIIFNDAGQRRVNNDFNVVVVDDDLINLKVAGQILCDGGIRTTVIKSGRALLSYAENNIPDLILLDIKMPDMDGYETLKRLREMNGNASMAPVIFLTGDESMAAESRGLSLGAMDFIKKPFVPEILLLRVRHSLELIMLQRSLSIEVEKKTKENKSLFLHVVQAIANAIDEKDNYTKGHSSRVALYSKEIARRVGYNEKEQNDIYMTGLLHDTGKIGVDDAIINKTIKLEKKEFDEIKKHPLMGARILENITEMPMLSIGAKCHHERYDGTGYPDGLKGKDIPEVARIIAVADAYDAMTSNRSYRKTMSQDEVRKEIVNGCGTQFDPVFAQIMLEMIDEDVEYKLREKKDEEQ